MVLERAHTRAHLLFFRLFIGNEQHTHTHSHESLGRRHEVHAVETLHLADPFWMCVDMSVGLLHHLDRLVMHIVPLILPCEKCRNNYTRAHSHRESEDSRQTGVRRSHVCVAVVHEG